MVHFRKNEDLPEVSLTISFRSYVRLTILIIVTLILVAAAHKAAHALLLIFSAFFLALALNAPVYWLGKRLPGKRKGSRVLATTLSFLIVIVLLGGFFASIVPPLVHQTEKLVIAAPHLVRDFHSQNNAVGRFIRHYHLEKQVNQIAGQLQERLKHAGGTAFSSAQKVGNSFFSTLTILVMAFMMLVEGPRWLAFARDIIPDRHHKLADRMASDMYRVIKGFVN